MSDDFHSKPFDEGTLTKLRLFQDYLASWLPVFTAPGHIYPCITIADFFAGPGRDCTGTLGSPLRALAEIRRIAPQVRAAGYPIRLVLNELHRGKIRALREALSAETGLNGICQYDILSEDFDRAFDRTYDSLKTGPNLLFLDQQGVKFISDDVYSRMVVLPRTDFMFFIASSSLRRFADHPHFKKHLEIPKGDITARQFNETHRAVVEHYRTLVPPDTQLYLGRFSIKKGSNLYGLIFGSRHPLGIEKFLRVCWKEDPTTGEANFDIDGDRIDARAPHLFAEMDRPKKVVLFEESLRRRVLSGILESDRDVYLATLLDGFLPRHGRAVVADLIRNGQLTMADPRLKPRVSKDGYENPRRFRITAS